MTREENIRAILDTCFSESKDEIKEVALNNIMSLSADAVQGEWHQISPARIYECSICNHNVLTDYIDTYNYCPNCGTIMVKGGDTKNCVFPQKLVAETFYCVDGERKGGEEK